VSPKAGHLAVSRGSNGRKAPAQQPGRSATNSKRGKILTRTGSNTLTNKSESHTHLQGITDPNKDGNQSVNQNNQMVTAHNFDQTLRIAQ